LHKAADEGNHDVAEVLLEAGADPNLTNGSGDTPLDVAEEAEGMFGDYEKTESVIRSFA
jgi:ankyrin repeat protein